MNFDFLHDRLITEAYDYSCVMLNIVGNAKRQMIEVAEEIDDFDLAKGENLGRELDPHITILYGIHTSNFRQMEKVLKQYNKPTVDFVIKGMSLFKNPGHDVLKYDIESEDLILLNRLFRQLEHTNSFPEYHPHATIAYMRTGYSEGYINPTRLDGITLSSNEIIMSTPSGQRNTVII